MKQNAIILTSGLTGSSVLAGLIAQGGYWTGDSTHKKKGDYDTYENTRLIELNRSLFAAAGYTGNYMTEFNPELARKIAALYGSIDERPYREFVARCGEHQPWVWKDPRLWVTIGFWKNLLNVRECRFILLRRSLWQCWVSGLLRRQIRSYSDLKSYENAVLQMNRDFVRECGASALELGYDEMIAKPENAVRDLNQFLGSDLAVKHLESIYHKRLYAAPKVSTPDTIKALLIYGKNYAERTDAPVRRGSEAV